jgi:hypothetical protein
MITTMCLIGEGTAEVRGITRRHRVVVTVVDRLDLVPVVVGEHRVGVGCAIWLPFGIVKTVTLPVSS